jgi:hypothetical protein
VGRARIARGTIAAAALLALAAAPASAAERGEVGGPPTFDAGFLSGGVKWGPRARSKPIVIGVGQSVRGRVEIIGQSSTWGLCIEVWHLDAGSGVGSCPHDTPDDAISMNSFSWSGGKKTWGGASGMASPEVASILTFVEKNEKRKTIVPVIARPDAAILERLDRTEPFVFFQSTYPGCVGSHKLISVGYDAAGAELGRVRGSGLPKRFRDNPCRNLWRGKGSGGSSAVGFSEDPIRYTAALD